jgi:hypothetical protein
MMTMNVFAPWTDNYWDCFCSKNKMRHSVLL